MNIFMPTLLFFLCGGLALAQSSPHSKACSDAATTQLALHKCADEEARRADRALDIAYKRLLSMQKGDPAAAKKMQALEAAWTVYRDAFVEAMHPAADKQAAYGTMFAVEAILTRARLTRFHTAEIESRISSNS
jgi:uncharacterized protein YecT (DUF1311 family)